MILATVRIAIPALNSDPTYVATLPPEIQSVVHSAVPTYDLGDVVARTISLRLSELRTIRDLLGFAFTLTFSTYGFLVTLLAIVGSVARPGLFARLGLMLLIPYAQLLLATNNERLFVAGFPAAIVLAAGVVYLTSRLGVTYVPFLVLALVFYALNLVDPNAASPRVALQISTLIASLVFLAVVVSRAKRAREITAPRVLADDAQ